MLRLFNTLTRTVEDFKPLKPSEVTYYSCGPTVYDYAHIGHARTFIFADILHRVLELNGLTVKRIMNITDVGHLTSDSDTGEDKMEKKAAREQKSVWDIAKFYTDDFMSMLRKLNIRTPDIICKATDYISSMIRIIETLEKKGYTYKISDGIYFDTSKFPDYGKLTGLSFSELQKRLKAGARVEMVEDKRHPTDFALWKLTAPGVSRQMEWESPWGKGFPGWHIECSAMSMEKAETETLDIHTGGVDHIPIHHTNEIAQSEAATGKQFVRFWSHGEHLLVEGEKMSKSLGNFIRVTDIEAKGFSPLALRYLFLTAHYRQQMNFTWHSLQQAQNALDSLKENIKFIFKESPDIKDVTLNDFPYGRRFLHALFNDLNVPQAIAVMQELMGDKNVDFEAKLSLIRLFDHVLQLDLLNVLVDVPKDIIELGLKRDALKREKNFEAADKLRHEIEQKGYIIRDTSLGGIIVPK